MASPSKAGANSARSSQAAGSGGGFAELIWRDRYQAPGERNVDDSLRRVARAIAAVEQEPDAWAARFYAILRDYRFVPGGRILAGAGRCETATLFNCFVTPGPAASLARTMASLGEAAATLCAGGGVGMDFSAAPPKGTPVAEGPPAPGPAALLDLWDTACAVFLAEAPRPGAMMGTLNCAHPDIEAFAAAKQRPGALSRFNLSIGITDAFMAAVDADQDWTLRFPVETAPTTSAGARSMRARALWDHILRCAYQAGEPGVLFLDRIDQADPLRKQERIATTNPCGEVPLPDYGACDLGSLNLPRFVMQPFTSAARFDMAGLSETAATAVRLLDNVLDLSPYPLARQRDAALASRRIGLGVMGLADALVMLGLRYGEPASLVAAAEVMQHVRDAACRASVDLAREKGPFPAFDRDAYLEAPFVQALPAGLREAIEAHGIRNSHRLAIAPTGSISLLAGGVSSGHEPIFAEVRTQAILDAAGRRHLFQIPDPAVTAWRAMGRNGRPPAFVEALDLPVSAHLAMQATLQPFVDNAISKTVNVRRNLPFDAFRDIYRDAFRLGLKGCTVFRSESGRTPLLQA